MTWPTSMSALAELLTWGFRYGSAKISFSTLDTEGMLRAGAALFSGSGIHSMKNIIYILGLLTPYASGHLFVNHENRYRQAKRQHQILDGVTDACSSIGLVIG